MTYADTGCQDQKLFTDFKMEGQKNEQTSPQFQTILKNTIFRSMKDDLNISDKEAVLDVGVMPDFPPVPLPEISSQQNIVKKKADAFGSPASPSASDRPSRDGNRGELSQGRPASPLEQAKEAMSQGRYAQANYLAQKIIADKNASWLAKFKAKKLISQATQKQEYFSLPQKSKHEYENETLVVTSPDKKPKEDIIEPFQIENIAPPLVAPAAPGLTGASRPSQINRSVSPIQGKPAVPINLPTMDVISQPQKPSDVQAVFPKSVSPGVTPTQLRPTAPTPPPIRPAPPKPIEPLKTTPIIPIQPKPSQPLSVTPLPAFIPKPLARNLAPIPIPTPTPASLSPGKPAQPAPSVIYPKSATASLPTFRSVTQSSNEIRSLSKIPLILGAIAIVATAAGFGYLYWSSQQVADCQPGTINRQCSCGHETKITGYCCDNTWSSSECSLKEPAPLINSINDLLIINTAETANSASKVIDNITEATKAINQESVKLIGLRISALTQTFATLQDMISIFGLKVPAEIQDNTDTFNLLVYIKPKNNTGAPRQIRILLVLKQKDISTATQKMRAWETTMANDLKSIIMGTFNQTQTPNFQEIMYRSGTFRYKNLPDKNNSINYIIYNNLVIIGTSKDSAYFIYDTAINQRAGD